MDHIVSYGTLAPVDVLRFVKSDYIANNSNVIHFNNDVDFIG